MTDSSEQLRVPKVLAILLGVLAVGAGAAGLLRSSITELSVDEGQSRLAERFSSRGQLPFGFELRSARKLSKHQLYLSFSQPGEAAPELEVLPFEGKVASNKDGKGRKGRGHGEDRPKTEWHKLELREAGPDPVEAAFLFVDDHDKADALLDAQFGHVRFRDIEHLRADGEPLPIDSGHLDWGDYEAGWVHLRHYEKEDGKPTSHDTLRVNLSTGQEARVLYLRWARSVPAEVAAAEAWLLAFQPLESED